MSVNRSPNYIINQKKEQNRLKKHAVTIENDRDRKGKQILIIADQSRLGELAILKPLMFLNSFNLMGFHDHL